MRHTPGPWDYDDVEGFIIKEGVADIAAMCHDTDKERGLANANLIAAAPEMLELLIDVYGDTFIYSNNRLHTAMDELFDKLGVSNGSTNS
jgi:hypothetical protein